MAKLREPVKRYIVQRLACYDPPTQVAAGVREEFGIEIARNRVQEYDPAHGKPSKALRALFDATRKAFEDGVSSEPAAKRTVRIRRLARMAERAESKGNAILAAALYEQIAKECGDAFTNRREHTGKGGAPINHAVTAVTVRFVKPAAPASDPPAAPPAVPPTIGAP